MVTRPDGGTTGGSEIAGFNPQQPLTGTTYSVEAFIEAIVPILRDIPFVKSLELTCALQIETMTQVERWIAERKRFWEQQYDQLEAVSSSPGTGPALRYDDRSAEETHATVYHPSLLDGLRAFYGTPHEEPETPPWYMTPGGRPDTGVR